jgi:hypothetical protein
MLPALWGAVTWPIVGVIFWWIAGRGIEALIASRGRVLSPSITWAEVIVASVVIAFCLLCCIGFASDPSFRDDFIYPWPGAAVASGLWIILGGVTVAARVIQWRMRRQLTARQKSSKS